MLVCLVEYYANPVDEDCKTVKEVLKNMLKNMQEEWLLENHAPNYDILCGAVTQFVYRENRADGEKFLLLGMLKRGARGIYTFDEKTYKCSDGANPYDELFYYAVQYDFKTGFGAIKKDDLNKPITKRENDDYKVLLSKPVAFSIQSHLFNELTKLLGLTIKIKEPFIKRFIKKYAKAASYERALKKEIQGHVVVFSTIYVRNFKHNEKITSLLIEKDVKNIKNAFFDCSGLKIIIAAKGNKVYHSKNNCLIKTKSKTLSLGCKNSVMPTDGSVTSIGGAFCGCSGLTSITIPNSVTSIDSYAFRDCSGIESITVSKDNKVYHSENNCLIETENKTLVLGCKNSIIPTDGSVTSIGSYAFECCSGLTSIAIPNGVTSIGEGAFIKCSGLTSIAIPNGVTEIGVDTFRSCSRLTSITIPNSVTSIGEGAFIECSGLTSIAIPNSVTSIGEFAFGGCSGLTSITIPNGVTTIGEGAFGGCSGLTSIAIPNGVTLIGEDAFIECSGLTSVTMPNSVTKIGSSAFSGCSGLTSIAIPNGVILISDFAFSGCSGLTSATIPNSVIEIGFNAFEGCTSLKKIYVSTHKVLKHLRGNIGLLNFPIIYYYSETKPDFGGHYWYYDENGNVKEWQFN